jgi:GT2 family glycosyltransferase
MSTPVVSVVIPTYKRPPLLARCLAALGAQSLAHERFEVIVVDDGRDAATRETVAAFAGAQPALHVVCIEPAGTRGPAAARNRGWQLAGADIIAFTDDDTIPAPDWLEAGLRVLHARAQAVAVAGAIQVPITAHGQPTDHERNVKLLEQAGFVTANCFVRKATLVEIGGFDERFTRAWREDTDLYLNLRRAGPVVHAREPLVLHPVRTPRWGQSVRSHSNLLFDALLYKKHRQLYWRFVRPGPPWRYYATVGSALLALLGLASGATVLSAAGAAAWLLLTARFTAQRLRGTSAALLDRIEVVLTSLAIPFVAVFWRLAGAVRWRVLFL